MCIVTGGEREKKNMANTTNVIQVNVYDTLCQCTHYSFAHTTTIAAVAAAPILSMCL